MTLLAYLVPGLVQLRRGEWFRGLVFAASTVAMVAFLFWSNREFLGLYGRLRGAVPRSTAQELWGTKTARRDVTLALLAGLFLVSNLDGALGRRSPASAEAEGHSPPEEP